MVSGQCTDNKPINIPFFYDAFNVISSVWSGFNIFGKGKSKTVDDGLAKMYDDVAFGNGIQDV